MGSTRKARAACEGPPVEVTADADGVELAIDLTAEMGGTHRVRVTRWRLWDLVEQVEAKRKAAGRRDLIDVVLDPPANPIRRRGKGVRK